MDSESLSWPRIIISSSRSSGQTAGFYHITNCISQIIRHFNTECAGDFPKVKEETVAE